MTPSEPGSTSERLAGIPARIFPRTLGTGDPYAVLSSTPGMASPIFRTVTKVTVLLGIGPYSFDSGSSVARRTILFGVPLICWCFLWLQITSFMHLLAFAVHYFVKFWVWGSV